MTQHGAKPGPVVRAQVTIDAPIAEVWAAWTDKERLCQWYPDRVAGAFAVGETVTFSWDSLGLELELEVLELVPDARLSLRAAPSSRGPEVQSVSLRTSRGRTAVRLEHAGFTGGPGERDVREGTASGWQTMLSVLRLYVEEYFARPRRTFAALGPAVVDLERLFDHYTDGAYLERWLTVSGSIGRTGERYELCTRGGLRLSGEVLSAHYPRDVALACREISGVIVLRALSLGPAPAGVLVGAWVSSWDPDNPVVERLRGELAGAVDRLIGAVGAAASA